MTEAAPEPLGVPRLFEDDPQTAGDFYRDVVESTIAYCDREAEKAHRTLVARLPDSSPTTEATMKAYQDVANYIILDWLSK